MRPIMLCTREQVKSAFDSAETARNNRQIDRLMAGAVDAVRKLTLRTFAPVLDTRTKDWPHELDTPMSWRLWLDADELAAAPTLVMVDGQPVSVSDVLARPDTGPPFDHLELDRSSSVTWTSGATPQRAVSITGVFGYNLVEPQATTLAADVNSSVGAVTVGPATMGVDIGIGSLIKVGSERMNVYRRALVTSGQTVQVPVTADLASQVVRVTSGAGFAVDEVITVDAERMRIDDIAGNDLLVTRAVDGTVPAVHNGSTIYVPRQLYVERAAGGTTAAGHTTGDPVLVWQPPALINQYAIAKTVVSLQLEAAGYTLTVGAGDNEREAAGRALNRLAAEVRSGFYRVRDR